MLKDRENWAAVCNSSAEELDPRGGPHSSGAQPERDFQLEANSDKTLTIEMGLSISDSNAAELRLVTDVHVVVAGI